MPCNTDYMNPTEKEIKLQQTAKLLCYVYRELKTSIPPWISKEATNCYATKIEVVPLLCSTLKNLSAEDTERIVYDAHSKLSRELANWWEEHQEADKKREEIENSQITIKTLRQSGLSKLSQEEKEALNLYE